jgi:N6-L-threonylcarbamoyladenine synthase
MNYPIYILGIESSCDDTSAAVLKNGQMLSNVTAGQEVHAAWGGVVPELASRAHQQNIIPVVHEALKKAQISKNDLSAIAFTSQPGLMGSLLVGASFSKGFAQALDLPLMAVNHLQAHILAHFISKENETYSPPQFPFLCLLVSGGNSQIVLVNAYNDMTIIGQTIDDAAGEAFDKCAKIMGLPYPGGPHIDKLAKLGNQKAFVLSKPQIADYDYSFSGLKTSFLYLVRKMEHENPNFIVENLNDLCASLQYTIIEILMQKLKKAGFDKKIKHIALAGGVSANSGLRAALAEAGQKYGWKTYVPSVEFTTDNGAMVAMAGYLKFLDKDFSPMNTTPCARVTNTF